MKPLDLSVATIDTFLAINYKTVTCKIIAPFLGELDTRLLKIQRPLLGKNNLKVLNEDFVTIAHPWQNQVWAMPGFTQEIYTHTIPADKIRKLYYTLYK